MGHFRVLTILEAKCIGTSSKDRSKERNLNGLQGCETSDGNQLFCIVCDILLGASQLSPHQIQDQCIEGLRNFYLKFISYALFVCHSCIINVHLMRWPLLESKNKIIELFWSTFIEWNNKQQRGRLWLSLLQRALQTATLRGHVYSTNFLTPRNRGSILAKVRNFQGHRGEKGSHTSHSCTWSDSFLHVNWASCQGNVDASYHNSENQIYRAQGTGSQSHICTIHDESCPHWNPLARKDRT